MALKDSIIDTTNYVVHALVKEPITYVNSAAVAVSMTTMETQFKLVLYTVSIVASLLVSIKYILEIKKLRQEVKDHHEEESANH
jgi:hypothetical protein